MSLSTRLVLLLALPLLGCESTLPAPPPAAPAASAGPCSAAQARISADADRRANPWGIEKHLAKNFPDHEIAWLMKDSAYQSFVVTPRAAKLGRCDAGTCYLFASPAAVVRSAVAASMKDGKHDPAALGKALGLPASKFEGALRMMTLDLDAAGACVRLPVESDPGVWKCTSDADEVCFKFGGYTSGGVPELMVLDAPVAKARVEEIP